MTTMTTRMMRRVVKLIKWNERCGSKRKACGIVVHSDIWCFWLKIDRMTHGWTGGGREGGRTIDVIRSSINRLIDLLFVIVIELSSSVVQASNSIDQRENREKERSENSRIDMMTMISLRSSIENCFDVDNVYMCVSIIEHFISCEIKHDSRSFSFSLSFSRARGRSAFYSLSHINCHCRSPQAQLNVEWERGREGETNKDVQRYMCSCSSGSNLLTSCPFTPIVHIHHRHQFIDEESWVEKNAQVTNVWI